MSRLVPALLGLDAGVVLTGVAWAVVVTEVVPLPDLAPVHGEADLGPEGRQLVESSSRATGVEMLQALGYVDGTVDPHADRSGVLIHDPEAAWPGVNLYASRRGHSAHLIDMRGRTLHTWSVPGPRWQHVELLPDGDLLVLVEDEELLRIDRDSRVLWRHRGRFHHDMTVAPDGRIYALHRRGEVRPAVHPTVPTLVDTVKVLEPDGTVVREVDLLALLQGSPYAFLLPALSDLDLERTDPLDILHTNHIEVFDGALADRDPLYGAGHWLLSMRNINAIFVIDPDAGEVLWAWGPTNVTFQHHPTLLDDGRMLVFDNGVERSRVLELDPLTGQIHWRYAPEQGFFTETRGSNQRLPNGHTLITESDTGYVFEVTPEGRTVWRWANPDVNDRGERAALFRMERFARDALPWLDR